MAQAGYTPISLYYSTTAAAVPTAGNLVAGELAINIVDGKLYYENSSGVVTLLAGAGGAGIVAGSNTQLQFNNSGVFGASANLTWDGTTLSSTQVNITGQGTLRLQDTTGGEYVGLRSPSALGASYTLTFPADDGTSGQALITDGSGVLSWSTAASGDVYGPASSTDNAVARFDSTTGKLLQNSVVLVGDTGAVTGVTDLTASGAVTLSGGTANGVAYLNGSKVVTSGSALTFDGSNLGVTASSSAGFVGLTTQNTSAGAGASSGLGINNDSTASTYLRTYGSGQTNTLLGSVIANYTALLSDGAASNGILFGTLTNKPIIFGQNNAEQMRLTSTGLGIGTTSIGERLVVSGSASVDVYKLRSNTSAPASTDAFIYRPADNTIGFGTGSAEKMRLDSSGNLGLGVTPSAWSGYQALQIGSAGGLSMFGYSNAAEFGNNYYYNAGYKYGATASSTNYVQTAGQHRWFNAPSGTAGNAITFTQAMTLDASGNLGVGTTSPSSFNLIVNSPHAVIGTGSTSAPGLTLYGTTSSAPVIAFADGTTGSEQYRGYIQYNHGADALLFATAGSERARIDSSGNFGIGTTSVPALLNVGGNLSSTYNSAGATGSFTKIGFTNVYSNASAIHSAIQATNDGTNTTGLAFLTSSTGNNGTEVGRFTSAGRLGIGTSSPQYRLSLGGIGGRNFAVYDDSTAGGVASGFGVDLSGTSYELSAWVGSPGGGNGTFTWGQVNTTGGAFSEKMRLNSSGNLLVGTAFSPQVSAGSTGVINGIASSTSGAAIAASLPASATGTGIRVQSVTSAGTGWNYFVGSSGNGSTLTTNNIFIYGNGDIQNTNNSYAGISDIKLKENIVDATPKLASLMQVKVRNYNFIGGTKKQIGVIAQELETVFPAMVEETTDKDMEGNDLGTTTKSVKYSVFVPMLIKAMQEQQAIIESLKARLDAANL